MQVLINFLLPVIIVCSGLIGIVAFLVAALKDPQGWMNSVVITTIDAIAVFFPSTPDEYKIGTMINIVGDSMPLVGRIVVKEIFDTVSFIASLGLAIKIYKLIPFKSS